MQNSRRINRLRSVFIIVMLLLSTFAIVSVSGQSDKNEEKPQMTVKGTVSVAGTDKVIQKAWVYIHNDGFELETHTNEKGFYSAELPPGGYVIKVGAEGYHEQKQEIKGEADAEIVKDFYLEPISEKEYGSVGGEVTDAVTGEVIKGAIIALHHEEWDGHKTESGEHGYYEFLEIPVGGYKISAEAAGYYEFSSELKVPEGEMTKFDIQLKPKDDEDPPEDGLTLCGMVTDEFEHPIAWAVVGIERILEGEDGEKTDELAYHSKTETDEDGYYKFEGLKEGWYFIYAEAEGYYEYHNEIKLPFDHENIDSERDHVNKLHIILEWIQKDEGHWTALYGQVFDACTDKPLAGACVIITRGAFQPCDWEALLGPCPPGDPEKPLEPLKERPDENKDKDDNEDDKEPERERTRCGDDCDKKRERERDEDCRPKDPEVEEFFLWSIKTNDDGFYEFPGLMPGHYNMWVIAKGYISFYNEYDIHDDGLNVNVYLRPMWLEKPLERKPNALIKGYVFDEESQEPLAGIKVMVLEPHEVYQRELLDEMPPKEDPDYQERPVEKPEEGTKTRGETETDRDVEKERPEPVKKAPKSDWSPYATTTDREGYFELKIPSGVHVLLVVAPEYYKAIQKFVIDPEEELTVRVPMEIMGEDGTRPGNEGELAGDESSEADSKSSSWIPTGAEATGAMLNAVLAGLLVVLVILSMFVFRKYRRKPVKSKLKAK